MWWFQLKLHVNVHQWAISDSSPVPWCTWESLLGVYLLNSFRIKRQTDVGVSEWLIYGSFCIFQWRVAVWGSQAAEGQAKLYYEDSDEGKEQGKLKLNLSQFEINSFRKTFTDLSATSLTRRMQRLNLIFVLYDCNFVDEISFEKIKAKTVHFNFSFLNISSDEICSDMTDVFSVSKVITFWIYSSRCKWSHWKRTPCNSCLSFKTEFLSSLIPQLFPKRNLKNLHGNLTSGLQRKFKYLWLLLKIKIVMLLLFSIAFCDEAYSESLQVNQTYVCLMKQ